MSIQGTSLWGGFFPHGEAHEGRNDDDPRERLRQGGGARAGAMTAEHLGHPTAPAPLGRRSGAQWMRTRRSRAISAARAHRRRLRRRWVLPRVTTRGYPIRSEEHTSELQSRSDLVCRLLLE